MEVRETISQYGGINRELIGKVISTFDEVTVWCTRSHQGMPVTWITRRNAHPDDEDDNAYGLWIMLHAKYQHAEAVGLLHFLHGQGYTVVQPDPEDANDVERNDDAQLMAVQTQLVYDRYALEAERAAHIVDELKKNLITDGIDLVKITADVTTGLEFNRVCNQALRGKLVE